MTEGDHPIGPDTRSLSGDRPIENAAQDQLGYAPFARAIATSIVNRTPSDGIVYAIHGPWGSGKTSAVNMLVEAVRASDANTDPERNIIVVRFNPWWFSEQSDLTKTFFSELAATLDKKVTSKVAEGLRRVGRKVAGAKDLISGLMGMVPGGGLAAPLVKNALDALEPTLREDESLNGARQELIDALKEQNHRILVIIDDIDRLPEDEARQIFRLVKSVADLPNVIYLLLFDRDVARRALGEPATADGPEWLEKIVQASFDLPPVHPIDLRRMLIDGINGLVGDKDTGDGTRAANIMFDCVFPWIKTPRDVGRLLNNLSVSLPAVSEDVNITDFIAIETVRLFHPKLYKIISVRQSKLTGLSDTGMRKDVDIGNELMSVITSHNQEQIKSGLQRLFPRLESVWENIHYDSASAQNWIRERRICIDQHFPAYFTFGPGDDTLRETDINLIIGALGSRDDFADAVDKISRLKRRNNTTKASLICEAIQQISDNIPDIAIKEAADTLLLSGDILRPHHDGGSGFGSLPFDWSYWWTVRPLIGRVEPQSRLALILDAIDRAPDLSSVNFVVVAIEGQFGLHEGGEKLPADKRSVDDAGLVLLQGQLRSRLNIAAADGSLVRQPELGTLLFRWSELDGQDAVRAWTTALIAQDEGALALASVVLNRGSTHAMGDHVSKVYFHIDRKAASRYVDVDALAARLTEIDARTVGGLDVARRFKRALSARDRWGDEADA